jgi:hypothetical protein
VTLPDRRRLLEAYAMRGPSGPGIRPSGSPTGSTPRSS